MKMHTRTDHAGYEVWVNNRPVVTYPLNLAVNGSLFPEDNKEDETALASAVLAACRYIQPFTGGWARPVGYYDAMEKLERGEIVVVAHFPACEHRDVFTLQLIKSGYIPPEE